MSKVSLLTGIFHKLKSEPLNWWSDRVRSELIESWNYAKVPRN